MNDTKAPISFRIKRSPRTKQFRCVVKNDGNHEVTLGGEPCKNRQDVVKMIESHIAAIKEGRFSIIDETKPAFPRKAFDAIVWSSDNSNAEFVSVTDVSKGKITFSRGKKPKHYAGKLNRSFP